MTAGLLLIWGCGENRTPTDPGDPGGEANQAPVASAGPNQTVSAGLPVTLDASASTDPDGDAVTINWSLSVPSGSSATLDDASSATPTFTPDVEGTYTATATVSDGTEAAEDAVTITAEDNTSSMMVTASSGGEIESSDGLFSLSVPAGALSEDTEISITPVAESQRPDAAADVSGLTAVYDLQPSGLTFSTPAEVSFDADEVFSETGDSVSAAGVLLLSESEGVVEPMIDVSLTPDPSEPGQAIVTGGLSHFSRVFVTRPQGLIFGVRAPSAVSLVPVVQDFALYSEDQTFEALVGVNHDGSSFTITSVTHENAATSPMFAPQPDFQTTLDELADGFYQTKNDYACEAEGSGRVGSRIRVDALYGDGEPAVVTVHLTQEVACSRGVSAAFIPAGVAWNPLVSPNRSIVAFGAEGPRTLNTETGTVVDAMPTREWGVDPTDWVHPLSDGTFFAHLLLGNAFWLDPAESDSTYFVHVDDDQPNDTYHPSEDRILVASGIGELGIINYLGNGVFTDEKRGLANQQLTESRPDDDLLQIWGNQEGDVILGVAVQQSGDFPDAAFDPSRIELFDFVTNQFVPLTSIGTQTVLSGFRDSPYRHELSLECAPNGVDRYVCMFSAGSPSFVASTKDGFFEIFDVDVAQETVTRRYRLYGPESDARVGGAVYPSQDQESHVVAVMNQNNGTLELYQVPSSGAVGWEVPDIDGLDACVNPIGFVYDPSGTPAWVASCEGGDTAEPGILLIRDLRGIVPGY